jgi:uncharacterized repeat protein (TIGR03803 family)
VLFRSQAPLVVGPEGALYGTTNGGGTFGNGTVFKIDASGAFTSLQSFDPAVDGANPSAALVVGPDGALYGTTRGGGTYGFGIVFKVDASGAFTLLHSFYPGVEGPAPQAALVVGPDGALYGTAWGYGQDGFGRVFKVDASGGRPAV